MVFKKNEGILISIPVPQVREFIQPIFTEWPMKPIGSAPARFGMDFLGKRNKDTYEAKCASVFRIANKSTKKICVIVLVIGAHQHSKHRVSSAWSVDITLPSILLIV